MDKILQVAQGLIHLVSVTDYAVIRRGMSPSEERMIALWLFMEMSIKFEVYQGETLGGATERIFHSSFSEEDLASNLIGFYIAALDPVYKVPESGESSGLGMTNDDLQRIVSPVCGVLDADQSRSVFDEYGAFEKVGSFENPRLKISCRIMGLVCQ